jgi:hypothetical protein
MGETNHNSDSYYFSYDGIKRLGPLPLAHIRNMVRRRELTPEVLVRSERDSNWTRLCVERKRPDRGFGFSFASTLIAGIGKSTASLYQKLVQS